MVTKGAPLMPQPGAPRIVMPTMPFAGSWIALASSYISSQVGSSGMVSPLASKSSLLYMMNDPSP